MAEVNPPTNICISCTTEYKDYTFNEKHDIWSLITLKAPCQEADDNIRAPIDIVAVIDKSGSMSGDKLRLVKKTLEFVLTQLGEKDRLSVVTYDTNVYLDFGLQNMNKDNKNDALQKIRNIRDGSCTNLCGGLLKGLCQIIERPAENKNEVASVLLFTDGLANNGITSAKGIVAAMKDPKKFSEPSGLRQPPPGQQEEPHQSWLTSIFGNKNKTDTGETSSPVPESKAAAASVYTFGFGEDHDPNMLKEISDAGNGMYYYIENEDQIAESFGHCLGGLLSTVAQGIQLEIKLENGVTIREIHSSRAYEESEDKKSVKISMGDLQSEEGRDVVVKLTIDAVHGPYNEPAPQLLFNATVDYFNVLSNDMEMQSQKLTVLRPEKAEVHDASNSNPEVNMQRARVEVTKAMKEVEHSADSGNLADARRAVNSRITDLKAWKASSSSVVEEEMYEQLQADLESYDGSLVDTRVWQRIGKKLHTNMVQQHSAQRSSNISSDAYATKSKSAVRKKAKAFVSNLDD